MKNIKYLLVSLFLSLNTAYAQEPQAQITVHDDRSGADEVIELPEGMTVNTDSLLSQWKRGVSGTPAPPARGDGDAL